MTCIREWTTPIKDITFGGLKWNLQNLPFSNKYWVDF